MSKEEEVKKILEDVPNINGYEWNIGQSILAQWQATLPEKICQLFFPTTETEEIRERIASLIFSLTNSIATHKVWEITDSILATLKANGKGKLLLPARVTP